MAEYIEREAAKMAVVEALGKGHSPFNAIVMLPAADVVPVVHGRWVFNDELDDMFHCTVCDNVAVRKSFKYCPHCGARMDGDA